MEKVEERIPSWSLCYIAYGDKRGISDEDVKQVECFYDSYRKNGMEIQGIYPIHDDNENFESYFSSSPAFGLPCDVVDCDVVYICTNESKV